MYEQFRQTFSNYTVISLHEIKKAFPDFDSKNLVNWQQKGYLIKLRNKYYLFAASEISEETLFHIANKIYEPSYISLETALRYYGFIPEAVYSIQSVSTRKTNHFKSSVGLFHYQTLKKPLYFGYRLINQKNRVFRIAAREKAILDFFYLRHDIRDYESIEALRWNKETLKVIDEKLLQEYLTLFHSPALSETIQLFKKYLHAKY